MRTRCYLVTGASTGIGRACVDELARRGDRVWAAVRTDKDEKDLLRDHPGTVSVLRVDLTDLDSIREAGERVRAAGPLDGLVNNAGVAVPGPLEYLPIERFKWQIDVNLTGQLAMTQEMLPALRRARVDGAEARVVLVGSIGDRVAGPMLGAYHASKFGLVGLADTLRAELAPSGIRIILIEPGAIATPIWTRGTQAGDELLDELPADARERYGAQIAASRAFASRAAAKGLPPQRAAQVIVRALTIANPRPRYLVGTDAKAAAMVARLPDRVRYRLTSARA